MRMQKTDMEFVQFDAKDVIVTSGEDYAFVQRSVLYNNYVGSDSHRDNYTFFVGDSPVASDGDEWIQVTKESTSSKDEFGTVIYNLTPTGNTASAKDSIYGTVFDDGNPMSIINWLNNCSQ